MDTRQLQDITKAATAVTSAGNTVITLAHQFGMFKVIPSKSAQKAIVAMEEICKAVHINLKTDLVSMAQEGLLSEFKGWATGQVLDKSKVIKHGEEASYLCKNLLKKRATLNHHLYVALNQLNQCRNRVLGIITIRGKEALADPHYTFVLVTLLTSRFF